MGEGFNKKNIVSDMLKFGLVPVASAILTLIAIPIISNIYPVEDYGKITLFYTTGNVLVVIFLLGMDQSYLRYYYKPPHPLSDKDIRSFAILVGTIADFIVSIICILFVGKAIAECLFGEGEIFGLVCLSLYTLAQILFRVLNIEARMSNKALRYGIQTVTQNMITKVAFIFAAFISTKYIYSILLMTVGMIVLVFVFFLKQNALPTMHSLKTAAVKSDVLFRYGIPCMVSNLIVNLNPYFGRLLLGSWNMFEAVGIFSLSFTIASMFNVVVTAFSLYWAPFMYKNFEKEQKFISNMHDNIMLATMILVALVLVFQNIIFLMVGEKYLATQSMFMMMMIVPIAELVGETTSYGIAIREKPYLLVIITCVALVCNASLAIFFVPSIGIWGAVVGMVVGSLVMGVARTILAQRLYRTINKPVKSIISFMIIVVVCVINTFIFDNVVIHNVIALVMCIIAICLYYKQVKSLLSYVVKKRNNSVR